MTHSQRFPACMHSIRTTAGGCTAIDRDPDVSDSKYPRLVFQREFASRGEQLSHIGPEHPTSIYYAATHNILPPSRQVSSTNPRPTTLFFAYTHLQAPARPGFRYIRIHNKPTTSSRIALESIAAPVIVLSALAASLQEYQYRNIILSGTSSLR